MNKQISSKKLYLLALFGNIAEWYDFSIYAFLATVLGKIFFASSDPQLAMIKAFAVFSIGYLARPIGSIFFGYIGDKFGRSISLRASLLLMAIPAALIGMLPTYSSIGTAATALLIILRFIQGFATGGEQPGMACYVYESAPPHRRNFLCSVASGSPLMGIFLASSVTAILHATISEQVIHAWAWRIPFLISIFILGFIFYIRKDLEETAEFYNKEEDVASSYNMSILKELWLYRKSFVQAILIWIFIQVSFYLIFIWMPSYLNVFLKLAADKSFMNNSIGLLSMTIVTLTVGYFAENIQPKKVAIFGILGLSLLAYPMFLLLQLKTLSIIILIQLVSSLFLGSLCAIAVFIVSDLFSAKIRYLSIGICVTISAGVFGGMTPTVCSYLIRETGSILLPAFFIIAAGLLALPAAISLKPKK